MHLDAWSRCGLIRCGWGRFPAWSAAFSCPPPSRATRKNECTRDVCGMHARARRSGYGHRVLGWTVGLPSGTSQPSSKVLDLLPPLPLCPILYTHPHWLEQLCDRLRAYPTKQQASLCELTMCAFITIQVLRGSVDVNSRAGELPSHHGIRLKTPTKNQET